MLVGVVLYMLISSAVVIKSRERFRQNLWTWPENFHRWLFGIVSSLVIFWTAYFLFHQIQRIIVADQLSQVTRSITDSHLQDFGSILLPGQFSIAGEPNYVSRGGLNFSPDGRWLSLVMTDEVVEFRRMDDLRICGRINVPNRGNFQVIYSPDTTRVAIWAWQELSIYQLGDCELRLEWQDFIETQRDVYDMAFSQDSSTLIVADSLGVYSINLITREYSDDYLFIPPGNNYPADLSWTGDYLATINQGGWGIKQSGFSEIRTIRVYDLSTRNLINTFVMRGAVRTEKPSGVEFLSDGSLFIWEKDYGRDLESNTAYPAWILYFADILSGQIKSTIDLHESPSDDYPGLTTLSPDAHLFVLGGLRSLSVWNIESNGSVERIPLSYEPTAMQLSPDRRILAVATFDGRLHFFSQASIKQ